MNGPSSAVPIKREPNGANTPAPKRRKVALIDADAVSASTLDTSALFGPNAGGEKMWLVKVPKFLADHWMELGKTPGADLGFVTVEQTKGRPAAPSGTPGAVNKGKRPANAPVDYKVRLTVNHVDSKDDTEPRIPRQYECTLKSDSETSKYAFVEDGRGAATKVAGKIIKELHARPIMEKDYRELLRDRTEKAARPARETKVIELEETNRLDAVGMQIGRMDDGFTKAKKAAPRDVNVRAEDLGALRSQILASFFHHEYASLDYLAEKLKQPKAFFKEQLQQFAQQERSGPYNGMWRLKPEYREFLDAQAKSAGGDIEADGGEAKGVDSEDMGDDDEDIDEEMADA